jgi:hypothetical protein
MNQIPEPEWIFPFDGMNVGDSFFIPTLRPSEMLFVVDNRAKAAGIKIKAYASSKDGQLGIRVWRIS